jgi:hypothetical protein
MGAGGSKQAQSKQNSVLKTRFQVHAERMLWMHLKRHQQISSFYVRRRETKPWQMRDLREKTLYPEKNSPNFPKQNADS